MHEETEFASSIALPKKTPDKQKKKSCLSTETVEGTALALEGVDNVERCDGLALGVLSVGDGVTDDALEEGLEHSASLVVDHC